jgi:short-subunit dehydrogenase
VKPLDVTDFDATRRVYGELVAEWGKVDVLFYNAGIGGAGELSPMDVERAVQVADVNYVGLIRVTGVMLPDMIARQSGEIVGMGSVAGYAGFPRAAVYSSSKVALNAYLQSLRIELHRVGIGVTTVNPGFIDTALTSGNRFRMPFMLTADEAAVRIVQGLVSGDREIHFPRRLSWPAKVITALPRPIYEGLARRFMTRR